MRRLLLMTATLPLLSCHPAPEQPMHDPAPPGHAPSTTSATQATPSTTAAAEIPPAPIPNLPLILAQDTKGTPDERATQLLNQLSLDEKILLLSGNSFVTHPIPRLGIPSFTMSDGPVGVRNGPAPSGQPTPRACAFPAGAALAATFDPTLAAAYGKAIGLEDRARGTHFQLGPGLNICRVPVNGRNFEYFGEDPFLASIIAANWVKACSAQGSVPTIKHFAANNQETNRNSVDAQVDERTLREIYLPAFQRAVTEGGEAGGVAIMCSYNRLNGSYASNNNWLLNQVLKQDWGFKGLVMSDWGASHSVTDVAMGLDLEMPSGANLSRPKIYAALKAGTIKQSDIDGAVHRFLRTAAAQGWLDANWTQKNAALPLDSDDSAKVALDVANASIVLLKNDRNTLPLDRTRIKSIVILGPNATAANANQAPANIGGGGSGAVDTFPSRYAEADYLKQITKAAGENIKVTYLPLPGPAASAPDPYASFAHSRTTDGQPGLTLTIQVTGEGPPITIPPTIQTAINTDWQTGQLPFGVPAGRDATFTWSGLLAPPQDGDWELRTAGNPTITLDGKPLDLSNGNILHLLKDKPIPITIQLRAQATPPTGRRGGGGGGGRGGRGGSGGNQIRVALVQPSIPDLTEAKSADAVILCVGLNRNLEAEGRDRPFELPALQQYLINAAAAANPHTIVITNAGAAVGMTHWIQNTPAVLHAWYLGQEGGIAIANVLFGDINPSGRLCSTFDKHFEENPAYANYPGITLPGLNYTVETYQEGIFYGYRGYDKASKDPLFPFGYGLSYTTFDLTNMKLDHSHPDVKVSLDVKNSGQRAGAQVIQIYVGEQNCPFPRPLRELKGFAKVQLNPGETRRVEILLPRESFAYWNPDRRAWIIDSGNTFTIEAATSERDIKLKESLIAP